MTLREVLGIELPIIQAPMAGAQGARLAVAVSNAGGLGSIPAGMLDEHGLRRELETVVAGTEKPYNVNFFCHAPPQRNTAREDAWRAALAPYYDELGLDISEVPFSVQRTPFGTVAADVLERFRPPVVSFHFGLPERGLLDRVKGWGCQVFATATTVEEATWLERHGVDVVIAQGIEAGGHRGMFLTEDLGTQRDTRTLLVDILRAVGVPVVAAGGIADARSVAEMMTLGAAGVQVGTAYLRCPEASTSVLHRDALASEGARFTEVTNVITGRPARGIVNRLIRELGPMTGLAPDFPLAASLVMPLRAKAEAEGSTDFSPLWAGRGVSGCRDVPAASLTLELASSLG